MQSVNNRLYALHNRVYTIIGCVLAILCLIYIYVPNIHIDGAQYGLSYITLIIALMQVVYGVLIYPKQAQKSPWAAALFASMILTLNIINLLHNTGQFYSYYLIAWGLLVLYSGMYGQHAIVGSAFLMTIYFVVLGTGGHKVGEIQPSGGLTVLWTYGLCLLSYFIWKQFYIDRDSQQIAQLSGALKSKQQQSEILIQSIADGVIVIDTSGRIGLMNPTAAIMTEWPVDEALGIAVQNVVELSLEDGKPLEENANPFNQVLQTKTQVSKMLQLRGKKGKNQIVSIVTSPVIVPASNEIAGAVAVLRDVSASRAEEHKRADFISTASHEMRTPVAAIEGYLALALNEHVSKIDIKARSYLEKAHASTQLLGKLFQDLLTSAKAEDGRLVSHPVVVEMGAFLDQVVDALRFAAVNKGLLMDYTIGSNAEITSAPGQKVVRPLYYTLVDPDRIREVITNIFDNAVKYTSSGKISVGLTGNEDVVQLFVRDTGPGIPPEDVPHLFQKFYRVDNSATRTIGGTGLGLFICKKIIELYEGRLWAESTLGKGSTFYINLPRLSTTEAAQLQKKEAQSQQPAPLTSLTTPVV